MQHIAKIAEISYVGALWVCDGHEMFENHLRKQPPNFQFFFITTRHGMQTQSSDDNSVCPSVCQTRAL